MDDPAAAAREAEALHLSLLERRDEVIAARRWWRARLRLQLQLIGLDNLSAGELAAVCAERDEWEHMDDEGLAALQERIDWSAGLAAEFRAEARRRRLAG